MKFCFCVTHEGVLGNECIALITLNLPLDGGKWSAESHGHSMSRQSAPSFYQRHEWIKPRQDLGVLEMKSISYPCCTADQD